MGYIQGYHCEDKYPRITAALVGKGALFSGSGAYHVRVTELQRTLGDVFILVGQHLLIHNTWMLYSNSHLNLRVAFTVISTMGDREAHSMILIN